MHCEQRTDQLRTLAVRIDGSVQEGEPIPLRNTLFGHAFGMDDVALLRLEIPPSRHDFEGLAARLKLTNNVRDGVRGFHVLGSGNGLRKGKVYAATPEVVAKVHQHFTTAEDALAYTSLLFSEAQRVLQLDSARVTSEGAGDGQGWIDADVLREHNLPVRQIQIRALWPDALAKGTLLPAEGLRSRESVDVLFHETQFKGTGRTVSGPFHLAIRDTAQIRSMRSSWTWTQFLDEHIQEQLFERYAVPALAAVRRAMESNDSALAFVNAIEMEGEEEAEKRDLLVSLLASGLSPRHPWVHRRLLELVRRTYLDAALGLGPIPLTAGMAACADDDRCRHEITCNWAPEGEVTLLRYPCRDGMSLRLVKNVHRDGIPDGSIVVHPTLLAELDGDVDGDWVAICTDRTVARGVRSMHKREPPRLPIPPRTRKRSELDALPRVAVESIGASGIGTPTWFVAACIENKEPDYLPRLSLALQCATMSLKWSVESEPNLIQEVGQKVDLPEWLEFSHDRSVFASKAPQVPDIGLGRFWNLCVQHFTDEIRPTRGRLADFLDVMPYPTGDADVLAEVETLRQSFNRRIAQSKGDTEEIRAAIGAVKEWASGKVDDVRRECARTSWYLTHRSQSPKSSGSFAIHAFPDMVVEEMQQATGYRAPVLLDPGLAASSDHEVIENRRCTRSSVDVSVPVLTMERISTPVRLIGGWRLLAGLYGTTQKDALAHLAGCISKTGPDPVAVDLRWVDAPWNGHKVLEATLGDDALGYVPEETAEALGERLAGRHDAHLLLRGKTVYATLVS